MVIAPGRPAILPDPSAMSEFDVADGSHISLRDYTCSRIVFDVLAKQVELTFDWDISDRGAGCVVRSSMTRRSMAGRTIRTFLDRYPRRSCPRFGDR